MKSRFLVFVIGVQLVMMSIFFLMPPLKQQHVLGASLLADDTTTTDTTGSVDSTIQDTPTPVDTTSDTSNTQTSDVQPSDTPAFDQTSPTPDASVGTAPSPVSQNTDEIPISPSPDQSVSLTSAPLPTDSTQISPSPMDNILSPSPVDTISPLPVPSVSEPLIDQDVIGPNTSVTNTSAINTQVLTQAQQQDVQIQSSVNTPEQTQTVLAAAKENVAALNTAASNHDYVTSAFLTQRVITDVVHTAQHPGTNQMTQTFCTQTEPTLQTEQLLVPENLADDIAIARGFCQTIP